MASLGLMIPGRSTRRRREDGQSARQGDTDEEKMAALLSIVAKLCLANALSCRVLKSVVLDVMHVPIGHKAASSALEATRAYAVAHKPATPAVRASMGMPHHHAWEALLSWVQEDKPSAADSKTLADYCEFVKKDPVKTLTMQVRHVRIAKCFNKDMKKLEVNTQQDSRSYLVWQIMKAKLISAGCKELAGIAPPGDLERRIQKALDDEKDGRGGGSGGTDDMDA
jgi:hypothetical protein